jgi:hypothetical protein
VRLPTLHSLLRSVASASLLAVASCGHGAQAAASSPPLALRTPRVVLLVAPDSRDVEALRRLAAQLDQAVAEMAPRIPVKLDQPLQLAVVADFVDLVHRTGEIGAAVVAPEAAGGPQLFLVWHPDDLFAYRYALARLLLARSGQEPKNAPWLARGAALWLSRQWYGRPYAEWLPLIPPDVLPNAVELAAATIDQLPGATLSQKLTRIGEGGTLVGSALATVLAATRPGLPLARRGGAPRFWKGVSLAMLNRVETGYHAPAVDQRLEELRALGADAVSLMPFAFQRAADGPSLVFLNQRPASETYSGLIHAARRAHAHGFRVLYKPHLWVSHGRWTGDIAMGNEADWALWFRNYRRYVLHHALLAEWSGAEAFSVGVELGRTIQRQNEWRRLIADVRRLYRGLLTYSGNWSGDAELVAFWDALDVVGVDAYFPLSPSPTADRRQLLAGAREVGTRLAALSRRCGRPILLTEVGFAARAAAWVAPAEEGGRYSEEDQALSYEALFRALDRAPWLAGTFLWKAFTGPLDEPRTAADFRFLGRQAERPVRAFYGRRH